jgi:acyl-coenzyme A synthetase/AMP-(fatty) acid ligase
VETELASDRPWPTYRSAPERLNLTAEVLDRQLQHGYGARPALIHEGGVVSYQALYHRVNTLAASLKRLGIERGSLVLIRMPNSPDFAASFLAVVKLGALPVLVNSLLAAEDLKAIVVQTAPRWVITDSSRADAIREVRAESTFETVICAAGAAQDELPFEELLAGTAEIIEAADTGANDAAFIVCTSGTTGKPKGIIHAHRWIVALGDLNRYRLPPVENDVVLATGEWSFISALGHNLLFALRNGVTGAILAGRVTPENVLTAIEKYKVTVLYSVATVYRRLLASPDFEKRYDLTSLRCAHSTGEALREATYHEWKNRAGSELYEHYGVSEYQLVIGQGVRHPVKPGSVGKVLPGVRVAILDDEFQRVRQGNLGQFAIAKNDPGLFLGYYRDPDSTEAVMRSGWYLTGDLAYQDEEGYVFIAGRRDDCFKSRGIFISPAEIENALQKHPAVIEAAVIPAPDAEIGNRIRAVVVLRDGQTASDELAQSLRQSLRAQIAPYKVPHEIEFAHSLPKSPVGKILRASLTVRDEGSSLKG